MNNEPLQQLPSEMAELVEDPSALSFWLAGGIPMINELYGLHSTLDEVDEDEEEDADEDDDYDDVAVSARATCNLWARPSMARASNSRALGRACTR